MRWTMLAYQIRLALLSLRRNPVLTAIMTGGIALGVAVAMTFVTLVYVLDGNPIPSRSDRLHYVQLDSWDPGRPFDDDQPDEPPNQVTYVDMVGLMESDIPTHQSGMYKGYLTVHPPGDGRPFREHVRLCSGDFFPMFEVPFRFGSGWGDDADRTFEPVVVLGHALNQKVFGGEDSVGRTLRIEDRDFRVVGVLEPWLPVPKFYDTHNGPFEGAEDIYVPLATGAEMQVRTVGNSSSWGVVGSTFEEFQQSEAVWLQMWVQLDTEEQRERYRAFLEAYVAEQKKLGRFGRPANYRLRDVMAWLRHVDVVPDQVRALLILALLFLVVCSVNLIGILLGKFLARAPETAVRRALGASRRWVLVQHLIESELIGVIGGAIGLALSLAGLEFIARQFDSQFEFALDLNLCLVALALALSSALVASVYPAWRICRIQPGAYLKAQ